MKNKIMVIDDDMFYLDQLKYLLTDRNYTVYATTSPEEGFGELETFMPDVLLLDWTMPNISGIDIITMIRKKNHDRNLYIIMLSGKIYTDDIVAALTTGANDYVMKPFSEEELLARIQIGIRSKQVPKMRNSVQITIMNDLKKLEAAFQQLPSLGSDSIRTTVVINEGKQLFAHIREMVLVDTAKN